MGKLTRYYLGRVLKRGEMTSKKIVEAMQNPIIIEYRGTKYSFIDFEKFDGPGQEIGYFAKIAKYKQLGAVEVVQEAQHTSAETPVLNRIDAASAFVYIPGFSGITYRHIWGVFPSEQFEKVFKELVEMRHQKFFVGCDIEPIVDLRTFVARLSKLDKITELNATVKPPNPLFGPCWKSLSEYLLKRKLVEASFKETAPSGIETNLKSIAVAVLDDNTSKNMVELMEPLLDGVGDAALLMAADGYGHARIKGIEEARDVVIRTSENQKSFMFEGEPNPKLLYQHAVDVFRRHTEERGLEHP
ncbi:hypothetical protein [Undibacterium macrobrachii]|uniref:Uncharacterized protein n=1 Tax=Undibacterium macrobrachii TaxID=1119058 RepID=A0ABQ2XLY0_9BURK|nr:hypothetical protein [Undibacterium macrobrachii]GGX23094.1 hypothetical protein GCM10011282_31480 [Undibacterium macrobrachii]